MYSILLKWWTRDKDNLPTLPYFTKMINGSTLKECMREVEEFRYTHDLFTYTRAEIVDVVKEGE